MSTFKPDEWIKKGKMWSKVPPLVRCATTQALAIPPSIHSELFPDGTSLRGLINFRMPAFQPEAQGNSHLDIRSRFLSAEASHNLGALTISQLHRLPVPDIKTIQRLYDESRQAWLDGMCSVQYSHLSKGGKTCTLFPLFVVSYWKELAEMKNPRGRWLQCSDWLSKQLNQSRFPERRAAAEEACTHLQALQWNGTQDISDVAPVHGLYRLLGKSWLSSSQINSKLHLLSERAIMDTGLLAAMRFESCEFTNIVLREYRGKDKQAYGDKWLKSVGGLVAEGRTMLTIMHLGHVDGTPHWTAMVVSGKEKTILYRDSLGGEIEPELKYAYHWWLSKHVSTIFDVKDLDTTLQTDGFNCGILALNAVEHHAFPTVSLAGNAAGELMDRRVKDFNQFAERIVTRVCTWL